MNQEIKGVGWILFDKANRKVVIHRRDSNDPSKPNMWDHFGGGFEKGLDETEMDTLTREIKEELNITVDLESVNELFKENGHTMYWIAFSFDRLNQIELHEGAGLAWITIDGALSLQGLTPEAKKALDRLKSL